MEELIQKYCVISVQGAEYNVEECTLVYCGRHTSFFTKSESDGLIEKYTRPHTNLSDASTYATIGIRLYVARKILSDVRILHEHNPSDMFKTFFILYNGAIGPPEEYDYQLEDIFESVIGSFSEEAISYTFKNCHMKEEIIEISRRINIVNADRLQGKILSI
jgi:hypothetical protein